MTCVEFLVLRASPERAAVVVAHLDVAVRGKELPVELVGYYVLRHGAILGDVALMLLWRGAVDVEGSALGQELKAFLAGYGIINHAVWIAEEGSTGTP